MWPFGNKERCSKCGARNPPLLQGGKAKVFLGGPEEFRVRTLRCYGCKKLVCGKCAEQDMGVMSMFKCPICGDDVGPTDAN